MQPKGEMDKDNTLDQYDVLSVPDEIWIDILKRVCVVLELKKALHLRLTCKTFDRLIRNYVCESFYPITQSLKFSRTYRIFYPHPTTKKLMGLLPRAPFRCHVYHDKRANVPGKQRLLGVQKFQEFSFYGENQIEDFSALLNVIEANLVECHSLVDVSPFSHARRVELLGCSSLEDVSPLGSVYHLTITHCNKLKDVTKLVGVHKLFLGELPEVEDVSTLGTVHTLTLRKLPKVSKVDGLGGVKHLELTELKQVTDVSDLGTVDELALDKLPGVTDISALRTVPKLSVWHCKRIQIIPAPVDAITWQIRWCKGVKKLEDKPFIVQSINLDSLPLLCHFTPLQSVSKEAAILDCGKLDLEFYDEVIGKVPMLVLGNFDPPDPPKYFSQKHIHIARCWYGFSARTGLVWGLNDRKLDLPLVASCDECQRQIPCCIFVQERTHFFSNSSISLL